MKNIKYTAKGYLVDENNNYIEKDITCMLNDNYISLTDGKVAMMTKSEELIPDLDDRKIYLEIYNFKTGKTFKKYFHTEFDKDKFKRKLKYSQNLKVVYDSIGDLYE